MAEILAGGCRVSDMCEGEPLSEGTLRIWNRIGRATGAQAISLRIMEFAPGLSPGIRNEECDEILYAINLSSAIDTNRNEVGTARVSGWINLLIDGRTYQLLNDTGIYIRPGETFAIDNPGPDPLMLISSQCPDPDRTPDFVTPLTPFPIDSEPANPSPIVRLVDRAPQSTSDRWYRVLVDEEIGSTRVTQFVGSIP